MYLLDTNLVTELRKARHGKADSGLAEWADNVVATDLYLSSEIGLGLVRATVKLPRKLALATRRSIALAKLTPMALPPAKSIYSRTYPVAAIRSIVTDRHP